MPGLHTFRITNAGMQVFPRIPEQQRERVVRSDRRLATGVPGLDEMTGGGIPAGDVVLLTGPAGSGKTTFAAQFVAQGLSEGESCVIAVFEEYPEAYLARAKIPAADLGQDDRRRPVRRDLSSPARFVGRRDAGRDSAAPCIASAQRAS